MQNPLGTVVVPIAAMIVTDAIKRTGMLPKSGPKRRAALQAITLSTALAVQFAVSLATGVPVNETTAWGLASEAVIEALAAMGIYSQARGHQSQASTSKPGT